MQHINWFSKEAFVELNEVIERRVLSIPYLDQELHFKVDLSQVLDLLPVELAEGVQDEDTFLDLQRWYGKSNGRYLTLDLASPITSEDPKSTTVIVTTSYPAAADNRFDWMTLIDLEFLPRNIIAAPVCFISSREDCSTHCVTTDDEREFNYPIYWAGSKEDATSCVSYLKELGNAGFYEVSEVEPPCNWVVIRNENGKSKIVGNYPDKSDALFVACHLSKAEPLSFLVKSGDRTIDGRIYEVIEGRVVGMTTDA